MITKPDNIPLCWTMNLECTVLSLLCYWVCNIKIKPRGTESLSQVTSHLCTEGHTWNDGTHGQCLTQVRSGLFSLIMLVKFWRIILHLKNKLGIWWWCDIYMCLWRPCTSNWWFLLIGKYLNVFTFLIAVLVVIVYLTWKLHLPLYDKSPHKTPLTFDQIHKFKLIILIQANLDLCSIYWAWAQLKPEFLKRHRCHTQSWIPSCEGKANCNEASFLLFNTVCLPCPS